MPFSRGNHPTPIRLVVWRLRSLHRPPLRPGVAVLSSLPPSPATAKKRRKRKKRKIQGGARHRRRGFRRRPALRRRTRARVRPPGIAAGARGSVSVAPALAGAAVGGITPVRPARVDSVLFPWYGTLALIGWGCSVHWGSLFSLGDQIKIPSFLRFLLLIPGLVCCAGVT